MRFPTLAALFAAALLAAACQTPLIGDGGGTAGQTTAEGKSTTMEPQVAYAAAGAIGGAEATRLSYGRQETGTQAAPQIVQNLQPAAGATVAADYPALATIVNVFIPTMGNSQRDSTLDSAQLEKIAGVVEKAADALRAAKEKADAAE